jgi:hypothetical protein
MLLRTTALAIAGALALGAPSALADSASATPPAAYVEHTAPTPATHDDSSSYAAREQHDQKQVANYKGGSFVVIGISGGALIIILVLLLIFA